MPNCIGGYLIQLAILQAINKMTHQTKKPSSKPGLMRNQIQMDVRCSFYSNHKLHKFLADPMNYRVEHHA
jgi:hypothetical protein